MMKNRFTNSEGFTFIELILVMLIMGIIMGAGLGFSVLSQQRGAVDQTAQELKAVLDRARFQSIAKKDDHEYGIRLFEDRYELFADPPYEEFNVIQTVQMPDNVTIRPELSGESSVEFEAGSGFSSVSGYIVIEHLEGASQRISISKSGFFETLACTAEIC